MLSNTQTAHTEKTERARDMHTDMRTRSRNADVKIYGQNFRRGRLMVSDVGLGHRVGWDAGGGAGHGG